MAEPVQDQKQQQQEQNPAFHAELQRNLFLAETLPSVKNGFLSREQAAYCMGWKDIVNPQSDPQTILYNAMGPDIVTPLLTTNAATI